ncbi:MAG: hypothetical protein ACSHX5_04020 [Phycisphaerales bacterium]
MNTKLVLLILVLVAILLASIVAYSQMELGGINKLAADVEIRLVDYGPDGDSVFEAWTELGEWDPVQQFNNRNEDKIGKGSSGAWSKLVSLWLCEYSSIDSYIIANGSLQEIANRSEEQSVRIKEFAHKIEQIYESASLSQNLYPILPHDSYSDPNYVYAWAQCRAEKIDFDDSYNDLNIPLLHTAPLSIDVLTLLNSVFVDISLQAIAAHDWVLLNQQLKNMQRSSSYALEMPGIIPMIVSARIQQKIIYLLNTALDQEDIGSVLAEAAHEVASSPPIEYDWKQGALYFEDYLRRIINTAFQDELPAVSTLGLGDLPSNLRYERLPEKEKKLILYANNIYYSIHLASGGQLEYYSKADQMYDEMVVAYNNADALDYEIHVSCAKMISETNAMRIELSERLDGNYPVEIDD